MADNADLDDVDRLVERIIRRTGSQSRLWIAIWLVAILMVMTVAALRQAPAMAYLVLAIVTVVVTLADGRSEDAMNPDGERMVATSARWRIRYHRAVGTANARHGLRSGGSDD